MLKKLKFDFKSLKKLDFSLLIVVLLISAFGAVNIFSASQEASASSALSYYTLKYQIMWIIVGLFIVFLLVMFDYVRLQEYTDILYWLGIILLILGDTILKKRVNGADSWMTLGFISIQPSEFAKIGMILMVSKKLQDLEGNINNLKNFFILMFYIAIPILLIVIQPDMGMTMVCFFIILGIFFIAGLNMQVILIGLLGVAVAVFIGLNSNLLESYQKARITSFFHQDTNTSSYNYQLNQSKLAIGSGGIYGKGFLKGGRFVTIRTTDFIFSVVAEEWGMLGAIFLLILYGILIFKILSIARKSRDLYGSMICVGIDSYFIFAILQNIGMTIGLLPITGITLPFMSYGGSSAISNFIGIGLILNVGMHRSKSMF